MTKLFIVFFKILSLAVSIVVCLSLQEGVFAQDECAGLFFTPAWQDCFRRKFQNNWIHNSPSTTRMEQNNFPFNFPTIQPIINMPDINAIIQNAQLQAQMSQAQGFPNSNRFSSSSSSYSSSSSNSRSVISLNGRTWTIETDGIPTSSSSFGNYQHLKMNIGEPSSFLTSIGQTDNSLTINLGYSDGTKKWIKITLDSPTKASDLKLDRRNGILYIESEM